jgi:hypothetical protein
MKRAPFKLLVVAAVLGVGFFVQTPRSLAITIELGVGESKEVGDDGLVIGFDYITGDSRCPTGVLCFWPGDAAALIWADDPAHDKTTTELHTYYDFGMSFSYAGYIVTLVAVNPYPEYGRTIDPGDYVTTITILGGPSSPVRPATWSRIKALYN